MNAPVPLLPLAEIENWEALISRFRGEFTHSGASGFVISLLVLAIVVVVFGSLTYLAWRQIRERQANLPSGLFAQLCAVHQLSTQERRLLRRLARQQQLADPSLLFIEPRHFVASPHSPENQREQLEQLRQRVFG